MYTMEYRPSNQLLWIWTLSVLLIVIGSSSGSSCSGNSISPDNRSEGGGRRVWDLRAEAKIVGGMAARPGQFPYQVSLRYKNRHFCGASVLNSRWLLTAAHCLTGFNQTEVTAVVGTNLLKEGGESYQSEHLIPHLAYNSFLIRNDIGLIKVDRAIAFGELVQPIKLPTRNYDKYNCSAVLSGWGTTTYPGKTPNELQFINLRVIEQSECESANFRITYRNICTLNKEGEGACHGDSGGPLVANGEQIGVVSWGRPCAKGEPDVFTRVYSYLDWINATMTLVINGTEETNEIDESTDFSNVL